MKLSIVSFQSPWPADYGGVIDVYFKLRALRKAGAELDLHTYIYRREEAPQLNETAERVFYYPRPRNVTLQLSPLPFIVATRADKRMLARLAELPKGAPVLFEGLHSCRFLNHPLLRDKLKLVRTHNVEHEYYKALARSATSSAMKAYCSLEALKLRRFEGVLRHADIILPISEPDTEHFRKRFPKSKVVMLPAFYNDSPPRLPESETPRRSPYILYHGNLSVGENVAALEYICREVVPALPEGTEFIAAGLNPTDAAKEAAAKAGVTLIASPSDEEMTALIANADVNLLVTFQDTGLKLKLLNTLRLSKGHVVANSLMLNDTYLASLCLKADTPAAQAEAIKNLLHTPPSPEALQTRSRVLEERFSNLASARLLLSLIERG